MSVDNSLLTLYILEILEICIATFYSHITVFSQTLMSVLLVIIHAMLMPTAITLMAASLVHVSLVTLEMEQHAVVSG